LGDFLRSLLAARIAIGVSKSAPPGRKTAAIQNEAVRRDLMGGFSHSDCTWYVRWINLLRTWMTKHQRQLLAGDSPQRSAAVRSPFIPVVPVSAHRSPITPPELAARLPNGVRLEWSGLPADQLAHVLRLLSALPCSDSIPG
jgi:hypothetical protein